VMVVVVGMEVLLGMEVVGMMVLVIVAAMK
jgi:hypothetical protein